jgi:hypothetical protein
MPQAIISRIESGSSWLARRARAGREMPAFAALAEIAVTVEAAAALLPDLEAIGRQVLRESRGEEAQRGGDDEQQPNDDRPAAGAMLSGIRHGNVQLRCS